MLLTQAKKTIINNNATEKSLTLGYNIDHLEVRKLKERVFCDEAKSYKYYPFAKPFPVTIFSFIISSLNSNNSSR